MKKISTLFVVAILGLAAQLQAQVFPPKPTNFDPAIDVLHQRLCQLNEGWLERCPDFNLLSVEDSIDTDKGLIQTHLKLVLHQLKQAETAYLTSAQLKQRQQHIETLREYMTDGQFPQNVFVSGYRPVFIDPWGTHCAVGHLIATSGAGNLANAINAEHQLDFLSDIQTTGLAEWQAASGLTFEELALIQPSYHSTELTYPTEIEDLILGDSTAIRKALQSDPSLAKARCGGKTLLHFASAAGDLELVKLLIENGADLHALSENAKSKPKQTPTPSPAADSSEKSTAEKLRLYMGPSSSRKLVEARWNNTTAFGPNHNKGGRRIGTYGRVFSTKIGQQVTAMLGDLHGGVADKNALFFATTPERKFFNGGKMVSYVEQNPELIQLNANRAEVVEWLVAQGLK